MHLIWNKKLKEITIWFQFYISMWINNRAMVHTTMRERKFDLKRKNDESVETFWHFDPSINFAKIQHTTSENSTLNWQCSNFPTNSQTLQQVEFHFRLLNLSKFKELVDRDEQCHLSKLVEKLFSILEKLIQPIQH